MRGHLVLPYLLAAWPTPGGLPATPALDALLTHAVRLDEAPVTDLSEWLSRQSRPEDGRAGFASLSGQADGIFDPGRFWLRFDPVHMMLLRDSIRIIDARLFALTREEADALVADVNRHFAADGLHLLAPHPKRWYVGFDRTLDVVTTPILAAAGQSADPLLPRGPDNLILSSLINEIQMLLYSHPVNAEREAAGLLPVNGVWPWGEGPRPGQSASPFAHVLTDEETGGLFAAATGCPVQPLPAGAPAWLNGADAATLVILDSLSAPFQYADEVTWHEELARIERDWLAPAWTAFRKGKLDELRITAVQPGHAETFVARRPGLWGFLKPKRTLRDFLLAP